MQDKDNHPIDTSKGRKQVLNTFKILVTIACLYFLYDKIDTASVRFDYAKLPTGFFPLLIIILGLAYLNWLLEAVRWRISIQSFETIPISQSWVDVLSGLTMNWVLPLTSGDFIARVGSRLNKYKAISAVLLNRGLILFFTLVFGFFGISTFAKDLFNFQWSIIFFPVFMLILVWIFRHYLIRFISYYKELPGRDAIRILIFTLIRYVVFTLQFFLLIRIFVPFLDSQIIIAGIGWIFIIRTSVPSLFGGIGLREASAFVFFENYLDDTSLVIFPVFIMWLINTVLPSIVGVFFIWKWKAYQNKKHAQE